MINRRGRGDVKCAELALLLLNGFAKFVTKQNKLPPLVTLMTAYALGCIVVLEGVGRVYRSGRSLVIRVPKDVAVDSAFPFQKGEEVVVQIHDCGLRVVARGKREAEIAEIMSKQ